MKRSPRTIFDDSGKKWYESPIYKEAKADMIDPEGNYSLREVYEDSSRLVRDRFYDFFNRITRIGESKIDLEELNKSLTIKVDEIPDSTKISDMFEKLNSKVVVSSKGKKNWSEEENVFFVWLIINYCDLNRSDFTDLSDGDWEYIASVFPGKKAEQCKIRWQSLLKINLSKAPWTQKEDDLLVQIIKEKGSKKWKEIAIELNERAGNSKYVRQGKQCRERWINHLDPDIDRGAWTAEEDIKLLEAHLECGKKWAEISKKLRSRTENAVKNRWNSLMKNYKTKADSETRSTLSGQSGDSIEDIERRLAHIIINDKKNELSSTGYQLSAVNEEDEYTSTGNEILEEIPKTEEEERAEKKKFLPKKKLGPLDVGNTLKELVTQEMDTKKQKKPQQTASNPLLKSPLLPTGISQINNRSFVNNPLLGSQSTPKMSAMNNQKTDPTTSLFNQINSFNPNPPMNNLFGVPSDMFNLNLLMMNPNNLFNNSNQQNTTANTSQANIMHSPPSNMMSPSIQMRVSQGLSMNSLGGQPENTGNFSLSSNIQTVSAYPEANAETYQPNKIVEDEKIHKYHEKSLDQLDINSIQSNSLQYAIVDNTSGLIYFVSPVTKDNFPPNLINLPKPTPKEMPRKPNFDVMSSPALGNVNFSPGILNNNLFNLVQNQFSPSVTNILRESPQISLERKTFPNNQQQQANINSWEWTPETHANQLSFMNDPNKIRQQQLQHQTLQQQQQQNLIWGGAYKVTNSPDQRFGANNSAFLKKQGFSGQTGEGTSPTSFIDSSRFGKMLNKLPNM